MADQNAFEYGAGYRFDKFGREYRVEYIYIILTLKFGVRYF